MNDNDIVELYHRRDESAITESDRKYGKQLGGIAGNILQNAADAEESVNETYFKAWNAIPPSEPRTYLFPFLARIVRNTSLNTLKKKSNRQATSVLELSAELEECLSSPDDTECGLEDREFASVLNGFLQGLSPEVRAIFMCRYWYAESIRQIAGRYGCRESKVKTELCRTREKLRHYLTERGVQA